MNDKMRSAHVMFLWTFSLALAFLFAGGVAFRKGNDTVGGGCLFSSLLVGLLAWHVFENRKDKDKA